MKQAPAKQRQAHEVMRQQPEPQPVREVPEGSAASRLVELVDGTGLDGAEPGTRIQRLSSGFKHTLVFS